ncbi:unnamed protein product [Meganyctiphanes norvegica]|uniref:Uncharacterized protein n=1 Tax=Meganyctiphanes norvegica TaxID=48144 RepID=A0AAV2QAM4_MEGNR
MNILTIIVIITTAKILTIIKITIIMIISNNNILPIFLITITTSSMTVSALDSAVLGKKNITVDSTCPNKEFKIRMHICCFIHIWKVGIAGFQCYNIHKRS